MKSRCVAAVFSSCILCSNALVFAGLADNMWFTVESSSGPGTFSVIESGPGRALVVEKEGDISLRIGINITSKFGSLAGWDVQLNTTTESGTSQFENGSFVGSGYDFFLPGAPNGTSSFQAGSGSLPGTGTAGLIYKFDIRAAGQAVGDTTYVTGDFGDQGIYYGNGFVWYGFVGPNPISYASSYVGFPDVSPGWGLLPVIAIRTIPEPTMFCLIGLVAIALIRRNR